MNNKFIVAEIGVNWVGKIGLIQNEKEN